MIALLLASLCLAGPDRTSMPPAPAPAPVDWPAATKRTLPSGTVVHHVRIADHPRATVSLHFARSPDVHTDASHEVWRLTVGEAVAGWSTSRFETQKAATGARIHVALGAQMVRMRTVMPSDQIQEAMSLTGSILRRPKFPKDLIQSEVDAFGWAFTEGAARNSRHLADKALHFAWYPDDTFEGRRPNIDSMWTQRAGPLRRAHRQLVGNDPLAIVAVVDMPTDELISVLSQTVLGRGAPTQRAPQIAVKAGSDRIIGVDTPGANRSTIRLRTPAPHRGHADTYSFRVLHRAIARHPLSLLNQRLRTDLGWTYGVRSHYTAVPSHGHWTIGVQVPRAHTLGTVQEIRAALALTTQDGIGPQAVRLQHAALVGSWNSALETSRSTASFYDVRWFTGTDSQEVRQRLEDAKKLFAGQTAEISKAWFGNTQPSTIIIVGDKNSLGPELEEAGLRVEWISSRAAMLGIFE